ncbi:MAG TPA: potassium transporter Kup [Verrucomicrobiae bacterium]
MKTASGESAESGATSAGSSDPHPSHTEMLRKPAGRYLLLLAFGALGVVYGDIGTSPLYALRECFHGNHEIPVNRDNVLGVLSLIFWALMLIVSIKYIAFVLRADNRGEGGVLALMSLAMPEKRGQRPRGIARWVLLIGVFGAALLYGDGIITPAVSILSAVEGLNVATPKFQSYVIPITVVIIIGLFAIQRHGTGNMGKMFGPVTFIWFVTITILGVRGIIEDPTVFAALNPLHGIRFLLHAGQMGFFVLGAVVLAITGGEALYADMGHFGRKPIRLAWYGLVCPALVINYFGQGAWLLSHPTAKENPFYNLTPSWALYPMVVIATSAAVIASQALISGAYSLTMQAIQLGYCPRMRIDHTSSETRGQIYMPQLNWALMLACIALVLGFKSSSNLAAAYGVAVTFTMLTTTILFYFAARRLWNWPRWPAGLLCGFFIIIEGILCTANLLKIAHGGWVPLVIAAIVFVLMTTWKTGRRVLGDRLRSSFIPLPLFLDDVQKTAPHRVAGTAVFMSSNADATPLALLHNLKHNRVLHQSVVFLTIQVEDVPHVHAAGRITLEKMREGFHRVIARYGFMEDPNVPEVLDQCRPLGLEFESMSTTFFLSRETILATKAPGMMMWRERLFAFLSRNAQRPTDFFRIPANRVVELGMQVEM